MRATYAIVLEISLEGLAPGFWQSIASYEFCQGLDRGNLRYRNELARVEAEDVTLDNENQWRQVVGRLAHQIALPSLRRILDRPELDSVQAQAIAHIHVMAVPNVPNPQSSHGMEGENASVVCPDCGNPMVLRSGRNGPFYGCRNYPACKGTRRISA